MPACRSYSGARDTGQVRPQHPRTATASPCAAGAMKRPTPDVVKRHDGSTHVIARYPPSIRRPPVVRGVAGILRKCHDKRDARPDPGPYPSRNSACSGTGSGISECRDKTDLEDQARHQQSHRRGHAVNKPVYRPDAVSLAIAMLAGLLMWAVLIAGIRSIL